MIEEERRWKNRRQEPESKDCGKRKSCRLLPRSSLLSRWGEGEKEEKSGWVVGGCDKKRQEVQRRKETTLSWLWLTVIDRLSGFNSFLCCVCVLKRERESFMTGCLSPHPPLCLVCCPSSPCMCVCLIHGTYSIGLTNWQPNSRACWVLVCVCGRQSVGYWVNTGG